MRLSTFSFSFTLSQVASCPAPWKNVHGKFSLGIFLIFGTIFRIQFPSVYIENSMKMSFREFLTRFHRQQARSIFSMLDFLVFIVAVGKKCFMESRLIRQMSVVN